MDIKEIKKDAHEENGLDEQCSKNQQTGNLGKKDKDQGSSFFIELVKIVLLAFLVVIPIRTFIFQPFFVQGSSMEPNFHNGEYLIVNELGYKKTVVAAGGKAFFSVKPFKNLRRGTTIVFRYPKDPERFFIKRIIGLPGERIVIKNNKVTVYSEDYPNGFLLEEKDYLPNHFKTEGDEDVKLKGNDYFVMGDNRLHSSDSREWGVLPGDLIVGKVLLRAWPLRRFGIF